MFSVLFWPFIGLDGGSCEQYMWLTVELTIEHIMSKHESTMVDSGTHAGNQVPVGDFLSIVNGRRAKTPMG
jgi:hypothetical protein